MDHSFWHARWDEGRIGFHRPAPNEHLLRYADLAWPATTQARKGTVLVPLCGKSVDLEWLATRFERVIGVEFVRTAADQFFAERGLVPTIADGPAGPILSHGPVSIRVQDFLTLDAASLGPIDAVWDRAALIALPPGLRQQYADRVVALMPEGAVSLLVSFAYPQELMPGPPFSVGDDEIVSLFLLWPRSATLRSEFSGCRGGTAAAPETPSRVAMRRLEHGFVLEARPAALADDVPITTSTWLITRI